MFLSQLDCVRYLVGGEDLQESRTSGGRDVWVGLLRQAMEGSLDLGVGARLSHPEHLVGAFPRERAVSRGGRARRPTTPRAGWKGGLASTAAADEKPSQLRRAKRRHRRFVLLRVGCAGMTWTPLDSVVDAERVGTGRGGSAVSGRC